MKKLRIVYTIAGTFNAGGMERVLANKANYLCRNGYEVYIITTDQQNRKNYFALDPAIASYDLGINYTDHNHNHVIGKIWSYRDKQKRHRRALADRLEIINADIVISMFDHDVSFLYKIRDGSKKIAEVHFSRFKRLQYGRRGIWRMIDLFRNRKDVIHAKKYDRFVVLTHEDRSYWGDLDNITVIPNANSFEYEGQAPLEAKRAIAVGRLDYQKSFDELIAIWAKIQQKNTDWELHIYGQGEWGDKLEKQINALGLQKNIRLCAPVTNISAAYLESSLLLMTSRYEGLPMVLLEAQVHGLPLVAYACRCGPADVIEDGKNGFLIPYGNRTLFANKVLQLINNKEKRKQMGLHSKRMSSRFEENKVMDKWVKLFADLTGKRK